MSNNIFNIINLPSEIYHQDKISYESELKIIIENTPKDIKLNNGNVTKNAYRKKLKTASKIFLHKIKKYNIFNINVNNYFNVAQPLSDGDMEDEAMTVENYKLIAFALFINRSVQKMNESEFVINKFKLYDFWNDYFKNILIDFFLFEQYALFFQIIDEMTFNVIIKNFLNIEEYNNKEENMNFEYIQKINIIDKNPNVFFFGDVHSSLYAIMQFINDLIINECFVVEQNDVKTLILKEGNYIFFLGDIVDRGFYSVECLSFIMTLKILNEKNVFICKGNHETYEQAKNHYDNYMYNELFKKYNINYEKIFNEVVKVYNVLPHSIFVFFNEKRYYLSHGAFDICMLNKDYGNLDKIKNFLNNTNDDITTTLYKDSLLKCSFIDFLWGDYYDQDYEFKFNQSRNKFGRKIIEKFLNEFGIESIITGHQDTINIQVMTKESISDNTFCIIDEKLSKEERCNAEINKNNEIEKFITSIEYYEFLSVPEKIIKSKHGYIINAKNKRETIITNEIIKHINEEKNKFSITVQSDQFYIYILSAANMSKRMPFITYLKLTKKQ
jgi:hypothetical protein